MTAVDRFVGWLFRLLPAVVLCSALIAADGPLRWIGLLGVVPLLLAFRPGCPSCALASRSERAGWTPWVGH